MPAPAPTPLAAAATLPQPTPAPAPAVSVTAPAPEITSAAPASAVPALGASFLSGDALQSTIANMEEMGYPRDQILRALKASYNNPDRAVEYLLNVSPACSCFETMVTLGALHYAQGIPEHLLADSSGAGGSGGGATAAGPLSNSAPAPALQPQQPAQPQPQPAATPTAPQNLFQVCAHTSLQSSVDVLSSSLNNNRLPLAVWVVPILLLDSVVPLALAPAPAQDSKASGVTHALTLSENLSPKILPFSNP